MTNMEMAASGYYKRDLIQAAEHILEKFRSRVLVAVIMTSNTKVCMTIIYSLTSNIMLRIVNTKDEV